MSWIEILKPCWNEFTQFGYQSHAGVKTPPAFRVAQAALEGLVGRHDAAGGAAHQVCRPGIRGNEPCCLARLHHARTVRKPRSHHFCCFVSNCALPRRPGSFQARGSLSERATQASMSTDLQRVGSKSAPVDLRTRCTASQSWLCLI